MGRGAWWAAVHGVTKSRTWLSNFTFTFHFHALEKEMATHSSVLAQRIPGTGEPGRLPSMGLHRVGHNWSNLAAAAVPSQGEISGVLWKWDDFQLIWPTEYARSDTWPVLGLILKRTGSFCSPYLETLALREVPWKNAYDPETPMLEGSLG